jgi:hypothetical protein
MLLETAAVEQFSTIKRSVIRLPMTDESKVEPRRAGFLEHRHVRIVGHVPVDFIGERRAGRMPRRFGEDFDQTAIACAGFKHLRFAGVAAGFEVDHHAHVSGSGILGHEGGGPQ